MTAHETEFAWLERIGAEGIPVSIDEQCTIGRAGTNDIVLDNPNVSRHHALIHQQGMAFYIIDLGSKNGTYLNGRRVVQPFALHDRSEISIGPFCFIYRQPSQRRQAKQKTSTVAKSDGGTLVEIKTCPSWLLVGDLVNSTTLARKLGHDRAVQVTGAWLSHCKNVVDQHHGVVNKFLGDGFIAYWADPEGNREDEVESALHQLHGSHLPGQPPFRLVLHHGEVSMGGLASLGEENLCGQAVIFTFRMEKLAAALGIHCLVSEPAQARLSDRVPTVEAGRHKLAGFEGDYLFFQYRRIPVAKQHDTQQPSLQPPSMP